MLLLFALVLVAALLAIPVGLPGTWVMLAAAFGYDALAASTAGAGRVGTVTLVCTFVLAVAAEVVEFAVGARATRRHGGSRRAGWGAILGGVAGAVVGVPVPVVGSVLGAFAGAFAGAFVAEYTNARDHAVARRVATGAIIGRALGAAFKTGVGVVIAVWLLVAAR